MRKISIIAGLGLLIVSLAGCGKVTLKTDNESRYVISSDEELREFAKEISSGNDFANQTVVLGNDITLKNKKFEPAGKGDNTTAFAGTFDGQGFVISNLNIDSKEAGLFAELSGTVLNLTIDSGKVEGKDSAGAICAHLNSNGIILNSIVTATVYGDKDRCGGLSGVADGTIINTIYYPDNRKEGTANPIGKKSDCHEENIYISFGDGYYELENGSHPQNNIEIYERACDGLNNRICPLMSDFEGVTFNKWELGEDSMSLKLSGEKSDAIMSAKAIDSSGNEYELSYLSDEHCFGQMDKDIDFVAVEYMTFAGKRGLIESAAEKIIINTSTGENLICVNPVKKVNQEYATAVSTTVDFGSLNFSDDGIAAISADYFNDSNERTDSETIIMIGKPGNYEFSGSLAGMIVVDLSEDNTKGIDLCLNNAFIESKHNVGICIKNAPKSDDPNNPYVNVSTKAGSKNSIIGSNHFDMFIIDEKIEGAISTPVSIGVKGEGSLYIEGDIEGIESKDSILIDGGDIDLNTCDDSIASKGPFILNDGRVHMLAKDNCVDSDSVYLNGGLITGSSLYRDERFIKKKVRSNGTNLAGCIGLKESQSSSYEDESTVMPVTICFEEAIPENAIILMVDENDNGIIAVRNESIGETFCAIFSTPLIKGDKVKFYLCDSVDGEWFTSECLNIKSYNKISEIKRTDGEEFSVSTMGNQLYDVETIK